MTRNKIFGDEILTTLYITRIFILIIRCCLTIAFVEVHDLRYHNMVGV